MSVSLSSALQAPISVVVSEMLGHATVAITLEITRTPPPLCTVKPRARLTRCSARVLVDGIATPGT
jgi:hypothetical protein